MVDLDGSLSSDLPARLITDLITGLIILALNLNDRRLHIHSLN